MDLPVSKVGQLSPLSKPAGDASKRDRRHALAGGETFALRGKMQDRIGTGERREG